VITDQGEIGQAQQTETRNCSAADDEIGLTEPVKPVEPSASSFFILPNLFIKTMLAVSSHQEFRTDI
jgi:hypothetical protein